MAARENTRDRGFDGPRTQPFTLAQHLVRGEAEEATPRAPASRPRDDATKAAAHARALDK